MKLDAIAAIVLASGLSRRFGQGDKLLAPFRGKPLMTHCLERVADVPFRMRIGVVPAGDEAKVAEFERFGFEIRRNPDPEMGMGRSLALGVEAASDAGAEGAMVLLADMPFVGPAEFEALAKGIGADAAAVSVAQGARMPPVLFRNTFFGDLSALTGDRGARDLLRSLAHVVEVDLPPEKAIDIDSAEELAAWEAQDAR